MKCFGRRVRSQQVVLVPKYNCNKNTIVSTISHTTHHYESGVFTFFAYSMLMKGVISIVDVKSSVIFINEDLR
jgi:hypothetical protein